MKFYDSPLFSCLLLGEQSIQTAPELLFILWQTAELSFHRKAAPLFRLTAKKDRRKTGGHDRLCDLCADYRLRRADSVMLWRASLTRYSLRR